MELKPVAARIASGAPAPKEGPKKFGSSPFDLVSVALRIAGMENTAIIRHEKGKGYCVKSPNNPDWSGGCYPTKAEAKKRLEQVEAAKHAKGG